VRDDEDAVLLTAIADKQLVSFVLDGRLRIAEPHDYGIIAGVHRLFFFQVGGESRSGRPMGWRWGELSKMSAIQLLDRTFAGSRPTPSGRHQRWDEIIASVSVR
jgi:hypothetical protein